MSQDIKTTVDTLKKILEYLQNYNELFEDIKHDRLSLTNKKKEELDNYINYINLEIGINSFIKLNYSDNYWNAADVYKYLVDHYPYFIDVSALENDTITLQLNELINNYENVLNNKNTILEFGYNVKEEEKRVDDENHTQTYYYLYDTQNKYLTMFKNEIYSEDFNIINFLEKENKLYNEMFEYIKSIIYKEIAPKDIDNNKKIEKEIL